MSGVVGWRRWLGAPWLLALPVLASAGPFEDFRIPDHSWRGINASTQGFADRDHAGSGAATLRSTDYGLFVDGRGFWARDGETLQLAVDGLVGLSGSRSKQRQRSEFTSANQLLSDLRRNRLERLEEAWLVTGAMRAYPWERPVGLDLDARAIGRYRQFWRVSRREDLVSEPGSTSRQVDGEGQTTWTYDYDLLLQAGVGWGKVRDATGVLDAHVLEKRLLEAGALARPLSPVGRAKLASLAYVSPRYGVAHDRPDRFVWRDIERLLWEDGALPGESLDAWSVLRAREPYRLLPLSGAGLLRRTGYFVGPFVSGRHLHTIERLDATDDQASFQNDTLLSASTFASGARAESWSDFIAVGARAEYHRPIGWRWQFDVGGRVSTPIVHADAGLDASIDASCDYLIADRWQAAAFASYERFYFTPDNGGSVPRTDRWRTRAGVALAWYVEDRTTVFVTVDETQNRTSVGAGGGVWSRNGNLRVGMSYRIVGGLDAPGLIGTVRPLP